MKYFVNITTAEELKNQFRTLCQTLHPDKGGNAQAFAEMMNEYETACKNFGTWTKEEREKVAGLRRGVAVVFYGAGMMSTHYIITSVTAESVQLVRLFSHDFDSLESVEYYDKENDDRKSRHTCGRYSHIEPLSKKFGIGFYWDDVNGKTYTEEEIKEAERIADNFDKWIKAKEEQEAEEARKAQEEADKAEAAIIAEWSQILEQLPQLHHRKSWDELKDLPRAERKAQEEADKKAERKANAQRLAAFKRNIKAVFNHYFPGVKVSVSDTSKCWCESSVISWVDGPTVEEVEKIEAFDFFRSCGWAAPSPYEDYGHRESRRTLCKFRELFGAWSDDSIKYERILSEEKAAAVRAAIVKECPQFAGLDDDNEATITDDGEQNPEFFRLLDIIGLYNSGKDFNFMTEAEKAHYRAVEDARRNLRNYVGFGRNGSGVRVSLGVLLRYASKWLQVEAPKAETKKEAPKAKKNEPKAETFTPSDEAPVEGLELVEIAEGVAVVGDTRTTYKNRHQIKAHGATWNKTAQQWQGVTPEAVASLRQWFGMSEDVKTEEPTEPTAEPKTEPTEDNTKAEAFRAAFVDALRAFAELWHMSAEIKTETTAKDEKQEERIIITFSPDDCPELDELRETEPKAEETPTDKNSDPEERERVRKRFTYYAELAEQCTEANDHNNAVAWEGTAILDRYGETTLKANELLNELDEISKKHQKRGHILYNEILRRTEIEHEFCRLCVAEYGADLAAVLFGSHLVETVTNDTQTKAA